MKKFLTILLLSIIVIGGVWFAWHFYWVFGEGVKAGQLNNFMKKGFVFKTYEGKLIQTGLKSGETGGSFSRTNSVSRLLMIQWPIK